MKTSFESVLPIFHSAVHLDQHNPDSTAPDSGHQQETEYGSSSVQYTEIAPGQAERPCFSLFD